MKKDFIQKIKDKRWKRFIMHDKDPYICYRFVIAIESLLPKHLTQIKEVMRNVEEMPDTADRIVVKTDPNEVAEYYLTRFYNDKDTIYFDRERLSELRKTVGDYMYYLNSNQEKRLKMWVDDQKSWVKWI